MSRPKTKIYNRVGEKHVVAKKTSRGVKYVLRAPKALRPAPARAGSVASGTAPSSGASTPGLHPQSHGPGSSLADLLDRPTEMMSKKSKVCSPYRRRTDPEVEMTFRIPMTTRGSGSPTAEINTWLACIFRSNAQRMTAASAGGVQSSDALTVWDCRHIALTVAGELMRETPSIGWKDGRAPITGGPN